MMVLEWCITEMILQFNYVKHMLIHVVMINVPHVVAQVPYWYES